MRRSLGSIGLCLAVLATGCKPSAGENVPLEQARHRPWHYPVYEMTPPPAERHAAVLEAEGRTWHAYDAPDPVHGPGHGIEFPAGALRPVGAVAGVTLHAMSWDRPPYGRLYASLGENRWRQYLPATR